MFRQEDSATIVRGQGTPTRPRAADLILRDSKPDHPVLVESGPGQPGNTLIDFSRYYDPEHARLEQEHVWMKSWLLVGREEDLPETGDRVSFEVGPARFMIVRTGADSFKAFHNACLHRGTTLCEGRDSGPVIRCPYHGWEWKIDGSLRTIPSWWDFGDVTRVNGSLPEVRLEKWGGFLFINADPDCAPLEESLGPIPRHFADYDLEQRQTVLLFRKEIPANWKVAQEAFQEAYHVSVTHPQAMPFTGDAQTLYDIWPTPDGVVGRSITPGAIASIFADASIGPLEAASGYAELIRMNFFPDVEPPRLDPGGDLRRQVADWHRAQQLSRYGRESKSPDSVLLDTIVYYMFPNTVIFMSETLPLIYTFLPHASDPERSYFTCRMVMLPVPGETHAPFSCVELGLDRDCVEAPLKGGPLGEVFDQDIANMIRVQAGAHAAAPSSRCARLGAYQELMLQYWHATADRLIARAKA